MTICMGVLLTLSTEVVSASTIASNNPFVLTTAPDSSSATSACGSRNLYETAAYRGWAYSGFLYASLLGNDTAGITTDDSTLESYGIPKPGQELFSLAHCDISYCMLQNIFGQMPGIFYSEGSPVCAGIQEDGVPLNMGFGQGSSNLMRIFNIGLFSVVCLMVGYGLIGKGVLIGGFEGDILQRNFSMMTFTRVTVAVGTIFPMPGIGYSAMQVFMMYVVLMGVGFADSTFKTGLYYFLKQGYVFSFTGAADTDSTLDDGQQGQINEYANVQSLFNVNSNLDGVQYAEIMKKMACGYYLVMNEKISSFENYDNSVENNALNSVFTSAYVLSLDNVMNIDNSGGTAILSFGNYAGDSPDSSCGSIEWKGTGSIDSNSVAYETLNVLFQNVANLMYGSQSYFQFANKDETKDYYSCLQGNNIMSVDLMRGYKAISGHILFRPSGVVCAYDASNESVRADTIQNYVDNLSSQEINSEISMTPGCSGNCLTGYAESLLTQIGGKIGDIKDTPSTFPISSYIYGKNTNSSSSETDPTEWVINTGNSQFNQKYIGDLLVMTQAYKVSKWALQESKSVSGLYSMLLSLQIQSQNQTGTEKVSSAMNMDSVNQLTMSMLAPLFGSNKVEFIQLRGKLLTTRNLAVSANAFITSLMMILQKFLGVNYFNTSDLSTTWYKDQISSDDLEINKACEEAYTNYCQTNNYNQCFDKMSSQGCFVQGRGLIGSIAEMYSVTNDTSTAVTYNPFIDYIDIGRTILQASSFYLFESYKKIFGLYVELAAIDLGTQVATQAAGSVILSLATDPAISICNRGCRNVIYTSVVHLPKWFVSTFKQLDQDRIGFYSTLGSTFMFLFIPFGALLSILLPLYPSIIFIVGVFGWFASVIEALVAGPIVAIGLSHPEGNDFLSKAEIGMGILFQTFLRPVLIVFGFFMSICAINLSFLAFNIAFSTQYAVLAGGTNSIIGKAMSSFGSNWQSVISIILGLVILYAYTAWNIVSLCCIKMISMSNEVLSWVSSGSDSRFTSSIDIMTDTKSHLEGDAGAISAKLRDTSQKVTRFQQGAAGAVVSSVARIFRDTMYAIQMPDEERRGNTITEIGTYIKGVKRGPIRAEYQPKTEKEKRQYEKMQQAADEKLEEKRDKITKGSLLASKDALKESVVLTEAELDEIVRRARAEDPPDTEEEMSDEQGNEDSRDHDQAGFDGARAEDDPSRE